MSDGRSVEAELLGANQTLDLSLLRLLEPGPYPYVSLAPYASPRLGDWVLKLGHPLGYLDSRPPVVRLGRILFSSEYVFVSDCLITGGDSGGPFFDLDGRLLGIVASDSVPKKLFHTLGRGARGPFSAISSTPIEQSMASMRRGNITLFDRNDCDTFCESYTTAQHTLPREQWTQGQAVLAAFSRNVSHPSTTVVSILDEEDRQVALGTVVEPGGWIMTVASGLPVKPKCRLADSRVFAAQVAGVRADFDLALLRIPTTELSAVEWSIAASPVAGTLLVAPGIGGGPLATGIVSVAERKLPEASEQLAALTAIMVQPCVFHRATEEDCIANAVPEGADEPGMQIANRNLSIGDNDIFIGNVLSRSVCDRTARSDARRYSCYPILFEHDMPLYPDECGGPAVGLDRKAVGITVFRGKYGCVAIPAHCVIRLLSELMPQSPLPAR